jgi:Short C-terminal domain
MESAHSGGTPPSDEPGAEIDIPAAPVPTVDELWADVPFALLQGIRHSIGWQNWSEKKGGLRFVTLRLGRLGVYKPVNRYPMTDEGWAEAWREFAALDLAAAERVREMLIQRVAAAAAAPPEPAVSAEVPFVAREPLHVRLHNSFGYLGVRVRGGEVYPYPTLGRPALGFVTGARAEITDPTKAQMVRAGLTSGLALGAVIGPFALAPGLLRKSKAVAFVVCANGNVHEHKLDGTSAIRAAQRDAAKFNALAGPEVAPAPLSAGPPVFGAPADRLAEVARLYDQGLLTDDEYQAKRAEIISQL